MIKDLRIKLSAVLAVAMLSSPLSAWALGLGQIQVISQRDQPLLAEIPIISNDPSELESLQARLASPETFARIGLAPPQGIVSGLQFAVALSAEGRPVIRVTSAAPVQQPLLTFLLEVNWGQGRLVREYSALIDTPQTAAAPVQPPIEEAATVAGTVETPTSGAIVRAPEPLPPEPLAPEPLAPQPEATQPTRPAFAETPTALPLNPQPEASASASVAPAAPLPLPSTDGQTHTVRRGETLAGIAGGLRRGYTLDQTIVALLRANPDAFIGGNANRLKAGAVLRLTDDAGIARYTPDEAALVVREQAAQWRGAGRAALPQPPAVAGAPAGDASAAPAASGVRSARASAGARLEITPPSANDARKAGSRSGVSAGGGGDMLRQQELQQTRETLAARDAEVQELKTRLTELEQLQKKQNELIAMKDSELAAAQQRMAAAQAEASDGGAGLWVGIGGGLVLIAVGAWWFLRRRVPVAAPAPPARRRDTERLAAAIPKAAPTATADPAEATADAVAAPLPAEPGWSRIAKPTEPEAPKPRPASLGKPTWHSGAVDVVPIAVGRTPPTPAAAQPPTQAELPVGSADPSGLAPPMSIPGQGRLDLALAYIDMGDRDAARELLQEVATRGATVDLRRQAERLLQELG